MSGAQVSALSQVQTAALDVTRNLPEAHWWTRSWRESRFQQVADHFVTLVYSLNISGFDEDAFDRVADAVDIAIKAIEIHLLSRKQHDYPAHRHFYQLIEKLRVAHDGLTRGYSADPSNRPTRDEVRRRGVQKLQELLAEGYLSSTRK
jgi:hypothetical protein